MIDKDTKKKIFQYAKSGNLGMLKVYLKEADNVDVTNRDLNTPLIYAAKGGHVDMVRYLCEHGANVNFKNKAGETALMLTCMTSKSTSKWVVDRETRDVLDILGEHGANIHETDQYGDSALIHAIRGSNLAKIDGLLKMGVDPNGKDRSGNPVVFDALYTKSFLSYQMAYKLLEAGADPNAKSLSGITLAHFVLYGDNSGAQNFLTYLHGKGLNLDEVDNEGRTSLILSVAKGNQKCVETLLNLNVDVNIQDKEGDTALHHAATLLLGKNEILHLLISCQANPLLKNRKGKTAIEIEDVLLVRNDDDCLAEYTNSYKEQNALHDTIDEISSNKDMIAF